MKPTYEHIYGHQDRKKLWWNLPLEAQLNCVCKVGGVMQPADSSPLAGTVSLPLEHAAIFIREEKSTSDVSKEVRYCLGKEDARKFYTAPRKEKRGGLGWSVERFDQVTWELLHAMLEPKPDMYGLWLAKQSSDMCAMRYNMARRSKTLQGRLDNKCPNCGLVEKAAHLNVCPSEAGTNC